MTTQKLKIGGMTCGHCVMRVRNALTGVDGVTVADIRIGEATVTFDESAVPSSALAEAVRDAGYDVLAATSEG